MAAEVRKERPGLRRTACSASMYIFLSYVGVAMTYSPISLLLVRQACKERGLDEAHCKESVDGVKTPGYDDAQKQAALVYSLYTASTGVSQLVTCALLGCAGDAWGRRVPLTLPLANGFLSALAACALLVPGATAPFIAVCLVTSLLGGQFVSNHAAFAAVADVTQDADPSDKSLLFGVVEGMMWAGLLVGPILGGWVADLIGMAGVFAVIAAVHLGNLVLTFTTFSETAVGLRQPMQWKRANPFNSLSMFLETRTTLLFGIMTFGGLMALNGGIAVLSLYAVKWTGLSATDLGWLLTVAMGTCAVGLTVIFPALLRCMSLRAVSMLSCVNAVLSWLVMSICRSRWEIFLVAGSQLLSSAFFPVVRTGVVNTFGEKRHGESLAAVGCAEQLAYLASTPLLGLVYRQTEDVMFSLVAGVTVSGVVFWAAAAFAAIALAAAMFVRDIPEAPQASPCLVCDAECANIQASGVA